MVYVPNSRHYSKPGLASEAARLALLQIVVADEPRFEVSEYELNKNRWTEPIETIKYLKHKYEQEAENVRMFTVRGDDWLPELVKWTDEIVHHVGVYDFIFVPRGESGVQDISATSEQVDLIRNMSYLMKFRQLRKVSSTLIRERLKRGEIHDLPIPEGVLELIQSKRLYMSDGSDNEMDAL